MNLDSFFKFQNESRIDESRKFENRAYPTPDQYGNGRLYQTSPITVKICSKLRKGPERGVHRLLQGVQYYT